MEKGIQHGAGRILPTGNGVSVLYLTEDLSLTDNEGVQRAGYPEQVTDAFLVVEGIQILVNLLIAAGKVEPEPLYLLDIFLLLVHYRIDFAAVAGREDNSLVESLIQREVLQTIYYVFSGNGKPFAHFYRCGFMV